MKSSRQHRPIPVVTQLLRGLCAVVAASALLVAGCGSPPPSSTVALNAIQVENGRAGTTSWLLSKPAKYHEIEGYPSTPSARAGEKIGFSVSTSASSYQADIYRLGWYGGKGARHVLSLGKLPGAERKIPAPDPTTGLIAPRWPEDFSLTIPSSWISGIYVVKLVGSNGYGAYIPFVVRDTRSSALVFVHALNTDEAYNSWGGKSLYGDVHFTYGSAEWDAHRALKVTFQRPFADNAGAQSLFNWEYPMIRWLERGGYDVSYVTDLDVAHESKALLRHRAILVVGHNEYWSKEIRDNYDSAVAHGVNMGIFAGNSGITAVRYEIDPVTHAKDSILVCYREAKLDPMTGHDNSRVTVEFRDPPLNRPESELIGAMYGGITKASPWVVNDPGHWIFAGTGLKKGDKLQGLLGYEYDRVYPHEPHPVHLKVLAMSPVHDLSRDKGEVSNSTIYRAPSGAYVFNAGSIEWSWGLDDYYPEYITVPQGVRPRVSNRAAQTIARNLLRRFGADPSAAAIPASG